MVQQEDIQQIIFTKREKNTIISIKTGDLKEGEFIKQRSEFYKIDVGKKEMFDTLPKDIYMQ